MLANYLRETYREMDHLLLVACIILLSLSNLTPTISFLFFMVALAKVFYEWHMFKTYRRQSSNRV